MSNRRNTCRSSRKQIMWGISYVQFLLGIKQILLVGLAMQEIEWGGFGA